MKVNAKLAKSEIQSLLRPLRINASQLMISNCFSFAAIRVARWE